MKYRWIIAALVMAASMNLSFAGCSNSPDKKESSPSIGFNELKDSEILEFTLVPDADNVTGEQIEIAYEVVSLRLINMGSEKGSVTKDDDGNCLCLKLPEEEATDETLDYLTQKGELVFRKCEGKPDENDPSGEVLLNGDHIKNAQPVFSNVTCSYCVAVEFDDKGTEKFHELSTELAGTSTLLTIWLDDEMISAQKVSDEVTDGKMIILSDLVGEDCKKLADQINSGAMPFNLIRN